MTVYLLRHARAGRRSAWKGRDDMRPLTKVGRRQADAVADRLADEGIARIVSSPFVRCRQTVEPLAGRLHLPVDLADGLAEGARLDEVLRVLEKVVDERTVLCTHGDVVALLLQHCREHGVDAGPRGSDPPMAKGSIWELGTKRGLVTKATYIPPP